MTDRQTLRQQTRRETPQRRAEASGAIWEQRQQARHETADQFETVEDPDRVGLDRRGRPSADFLDFAQPREAAFQLDPQFEHQDLGPDDVERVDDGFQPREEVQRREAAFEFEEQTELEGLDPFADITEQNGGFGLVGERQREVAASELDDELPAVDLGPGLVEETDDGFRPTETAQRRQAAAEFEEGTPLEDIDYQDDIERDDGEFRLREPALERIFQRDPDFF